MRKVVSEINSIQQICFYITSLFYSSLVICVYRQGPLNAKHTFSLLLSDLCTFCK